MCKDLSLYDSKPRILVVDDTPENLLVLSELIHRDAYKTFFARNGIQALKIAKHKKIDLILLDVIMPGMDGFETCRQLKNDLDTKDIPVIFMTALGQAKNKVKGLELGAVDYVAKPIEEKELLARIKTHVALQRCRVKLNREAKAAKLLLNISNRINNCIRRSQDFKTIFQAIAEDIVKVIQCDRLTVARLNANNVVIESQFRINNNIAQLAPIIDLDYCCEDERDLENYRHGIAKIKEDSSLDRDIQSYLFAPILLEENRSKNQGKHFLWGWLIAENSSVKSWGLEDTKLCQNITAQFAIAINQKLLYKQVKQRNYQLKKLNEQLDSNNKKLKKLALHDPLTDVFNRRYFDRQLDLEWRRLRRNKSAHLSLIMCDVDCFKIYNDTYGHQLGDECLKKIANALKTIIKRPADILARYGGEEFAIVLPNTNIAGATNLAESMRAAVKSLAIPHPNSTVNSVVTISLGVAHTIPNLEDSPASLIAAADRALYRAKSLGRDCFHVHREDMDEHRKSQLSEYDWIERIRQAIANNLFSLYAQPITSLKDEEPQRRFEILLRLTDKEDSILSPKDFFDIAARNSLMPEIDRWVVNKLFELLKTYSNQELLKYHFSINLSGASLNSRAFLDFLFHKLKNHHSSLATFCFEITETEAISNLDRTSRFIDSVKALGCSFALDDFGSGMSSLSYLKNLPVDYLKIDGSFITELNQDKASIVMVEAIHHIAAGIGLKTVAEFVENRAILDTVRNLNVDYAQGYHLGYPQELTSILNAA